MFFWKKKQKEKESSEKKRPIWGIKRETLNLIFEIAKESKGEFGAVLIAEKGVINELMLLPGTIEGDEHVIFSLNQMPFDIKLRNVGIVHSHPSYSNKPSSADLQMFSHFGNTNIIVSYPYNEKTWKCYDLNGNEVKLKVID